MSLGDWIVNSKTYLRQWMIKMKQCRLRQARIKVCVDWILSFGWNDSQKKNAVVPAYWNKMRECMGTIGLFLARKMLKFIMWSNWLVWIDSLWMMKQKIFLAPKRNALTLLCVYVFSKKIQREYTGIQTQTEDWWIHWLQIGWGNRWKTELLTKKERIVMNEWMNAWYERKIRSCVVRCGRRFLFCVSCVYCLTSSFPSNRTKKINSRL